MRKWMPTLLLVVICIAGFWYASSENYFRSTETVAARLVQQDKSLIREIVIRGKGEEGTDIRLIQDKGAWTMKEPDSYPLNKYGVERWLDTLQTAEAGDVIVANPQDISKYGIDGNHDEIEITDEQGTITKVAFGDTLPTGDQVYARVNEGDMISIANNTVTSLLLSYSEFVNTTPFLWDQSEITQLEWEGREASWMLSRSTTSETEWKLNGASVTNEVASGIADQIKNTVAELPLLPASDLKGAVHQFTLTVTRSGQDPTEVYQGWTLPNDTKVWVVPPNSNWAYGISASEVSDIGKSANEATTAE
ncbi:DUF4340 domain-containing protein [Paenibacillus massiliensis]|uniref:DUF4340 domain-containing protein n=1 Tax=Paenibacillus massiliensis TaxID=225917 RepID=UPI00035CFE79|nr:DUF4340 domain-containing protein [Paenibacillus massiliensis]